MMVDLNQKQNYGVKPCDNVNYTDKYVEPYSLG